MEQSTNNPFTEFIPIIDSVKQNDNTVFMTVLNYGYVMYTMNMLKSLAKWGLDKKILLVCLDNKSYTFFTKKGYVAVYINTDTNLQAFQSYDNAMFRRIMYYKIMLIGKLLELHYAVYYTDGDIVYCKDPLRDLETYSASYDMLIQNDRPSDDIKDLVCAGLFYIRSNTNTRSVFNLENNTAMRIILETENSDQAYLNNYIKDKIRYTMFPLNQYPNGQVFYANPGLKDSCILVHFNWIKGHEKMAKIKEHGMWFLTEDDEEEI